MGQMIKLLKEKSICPSENATPHLMGVQCCSETRAGTEGGKRGNIPAAHCQHPGGYGAQEVRQVELG